MILALLFLIQSVNSIAPNIRKYPSVQTYSHCARFGPYGDDLSSFLIEWNFVPQSAYLDVRFTAKNEKGFVGLGFTRNGEYQIVSGYPQSDLACVRAMYNSFIYVDSLGNPYNYDVEIPGQHMEVRDYDVRMQLKRNLTIGGKQLILRPSTVFNFTLLWAYRIKSVVEGMCNDFDLVRDKTEAATFSVVLGAQQYSSNGGTCSPYSGRLTTVRRPLDSRAGFFSGETHQNKRIAVLFIGGGIPLESGKHAPTLDSNGYVRVGEGGNDACHSSRRLAYCRWFGFRDSVGGIAYYEVSFGNAKSSTAYVPWTDVGSVNSVSMSVSLPINGTIVCSVRAYNYAGLYKQVRSRVARILNDGVPLKGYVNDGISPNSDISAQKSSTTISAIWMNWVTEDHATKNLITGQWTYNAFEYAIGIYGTGNVTGIKNWQPVQKSSVVVTNLRLRHNVRYYVSVRSKNCAGVYSTASSNGVLVDLQPPLGGVVYDGNVTFKDAKYIQKNWGVSASWSGFVDTASGINHYEWAVGTRNPRVYGPTTELMSWHPVGLQQFASNKTLKLATRRLTIGTSVYVHVRAVDNAGWSSTVSSNGTRVTGY
eukprot:PhF_6_TR11712/c0_g1_i1/m.19065